MRCKDAQNVLNAWIDDELTEEKRAALEDHLSTCRICSAEAEAMSRLSRCLETQPRLRPSRTLDKRIMAKFMEESGARSIASWWTSLDWEFQAVMTVSAIIGLFIGLQLGGDWTGSQLLNQYSLSGFLFSSGDLLLSWA